MSIILDKVSYLYGKDTSYEIMALNADADVVEKSKRQLANFEEVLGNENTINAYFQTIDNKCDNYAFINF